jgi:predicted dehydrogenase
MARFITGDDVTVVIGSVAETFIMLRKIIESGPKGGIAGGTSGGGQMGTSDVDDAVLFLARFSKGAVASFEATRLATGNQNRNKIEINGEKGAVRFDFEDMNYLDFYDATLPRKQQGWTRIMVTHGGDHPYVGNWWPDAHIIGYEHGFINQASDMMKIIGGQPPVVPMPNFEDAFKTQQVLEAAIVSAEQKRSVSIEEMK